MKSKLTLIVLFICLLQTNMLTANNESDSIQKLKYYAAKTEIENMLSGKTTLNYKRALFLMENAYQNNKMDYETFMRIIDFHTNNIIRLAEANRNKKVKDFKQNYLEVITENEKKYRYNNLLYNWAIYTYLTDTIYYKDKNNKSIYTHLPYQYSFSDPMATINWENSQVLSLLNNKSANCFALASLYKIFAERLNTDANLGLAPGHIFITHKDVKGINYNIEVGTRSFPGTGSIMTLTYTTAEAVKNGLAMRTLDTKQSIALCLVYLAKGYEHKFKTKTDNFIYECAETTLKYDSLNLNAKLLKAEVLEETILIKNKTITQLQTDKQFNEYEKLITNLYVQGYREMPIDMKNIIINQIQKDSVGLILTNHTPKGFQSVKSKDDRNASLSWGTFDEIQNTKPIEQYNKTLFDTKTNKITEFVDVDILYNQYNFDPVVAAWQVDPLAAKYPMMSPYMAFGNNPILYVDPDGKEIYISYSTIINGKTQIVKCQYKNGNLYDNNGKKLKDDFDPVIGLVREQLNTLKKIDPEYDKIISTLESKDAAEHTINIDCNKENSNKYNSPFLASIGLDYSTTTTYNPLNWVDPDDPKGEKESSPLIGLIHEIKHAFDKNTSSYDPTTAGTDEKTGESKPISVMECEAVNTENIIRKKLYGTIRTSYGGVKIPEKYLRKQ